MDTFCPLKTPSEMANIELLQDNFEPTAYQHSMALASQAVQGFTATQNPDTMTSE